MGSSSLAATMRMANRKNYLFFHSQSKSKERPVQLLFGKLLRAGSPFGKETYIGRKQLPDEKKQEKLLRIVVCSGKSITFAPASEKTGCRNWYLG